MPATRGCAFAHTVQNVEITLTSNLDNYHQWVRRDCFGIIPDRAGRVLDLGGGVGATAVELKRLGRASHVTLIDRVADAALPDVDAAYAGNLEDRELILKAINEHGPFDTILCLDILEHLYDPWAVAALLRDGLAPGGAMIISVPNVNYLGLIGPLVFKGRYDLTEAGVLDRTHIRWFARHGLIELAEGAGLTVEKVQPNVYGRLKQLVDRVSFGVLTRFLAMQYVIRGCRAEQD